MATKRKTKPSKEPVKKTTKKTVKPATTVKKEAVKTSKKTAAPKAKKADEAQTQQIPSPEKQKVILQFAVKMGDTGSPEVQIALLTQRIDKLVMHLKTNPHDNHSRRGLLGIVSKRRRLINYLEKKDAKRVKDIKQKLGLT